MKRIIRYVRYVKVLFAIAGVVTIVGAVGTVDYMATINEYYPLSSTARTLLIGFAMLTPACISQYRRERGCK